jgi:hypothetical protein
MTWLDESQGCLFGLVCSQYGIGLWSGYWSVVGLDNKGVPYKGWESIDMDSELDLDKITFLD